MGSAARHQELAVTSSCDIYTVYGRHGAMHKTYLWKIQYEKMAWDKRWVDFNMRWDRFTRINTGVNGRLF
jgi:hypothetical protein